MQTRSDSVEDALARAVVYHTLAVAFEPPTDATLRAIGARDGFPVVIEALRLLLDDGRPKPDATTDDVRGVRLQAHLRSLKVADVESLASDYWRLFGHTTRGLVCACETEYGPDNGFHQPQQLADIAGYYLAFGLRPSEDGEVRPDHIACECEFLDCLSRKQARLFDGDGDDETREATAAAERSFVRDHLGRVGRAFAARVAAEDRDGFYGAIGRVLLAFVDAECARLGVESGAIDLIVRPEEIDDTPMACGSADNGESVPLPLYRRDPPIGGHP